jgi:hypothetical protein
MSRNLTLTLAALGTLASVALFAGSANAKGGNGNHNHPGNYQRHPHHNVHLYIRRIHDRGYIRQVHYAVPVVASDLCTCLTKAYTPEGTVVFKDLCTNEMASAPVDVAPAKASEIQAPTSFAGKTYQDYLAANPQAQAQAQKN